MIVTKTLKLTTLLIAMAGILPSLAAYRIAIPLETTQGGALPNGSIVIGNVNQPTQPTPPSTNCVYNSESYVQMLKISNPTFEAGDRVFIYNNNLIGYDSPSNGLTPPNGLTAGTQQAELIETTDFELCGDNLESYPALPPIGGGGPPPGPIDPPVEPEDPDLIPECLPLDTTNNYAAYDRIADKYEYNSTTYGIDHVRVNWVYKPADYDPNRPGSYQYLPEVNDAVSGPNPNYDYNAICRVKNRLE